MLFLHLVVVPRCVHQTAAAWAGTPGEVPLSHLTPISRGDLSRRYYRVCGGPEAQFLFPFSKSGIASLILLSSELALSSSIHLPCCELLVQMPAFLYKKYP
ncbi:unnamed protein product [Chrysodeixis includens]|uniref:Secreted protein n=1 Tax=Chrysodeixis includens TaxID=689277 RepID=A0A9N8PYZ2_CHRIL|nr:unnamed protein product [Chrysodeixis includens]